MKTVSLVFALALLASVGFAFQAGNQGLQELKYSLDGVPVYVKTLRNAGNVLAASRYEFDATTLIFLIKRTVDPKSWANADVKIEPIEFQGNMVLRVVQSRINHEEIAILISDLRKASPHYVQGEEEAIGVKH